MTERWLYVLTTVAHLPTLKPERVAEVVPAGEAAGGRAEAVSA